MNSVRKSIKENEHLGNDLQKNIAKNIAYMMVEVEDELDKLHDIPISKEDLFKMYDDAESSGSDQRLYYTKDLILDLIRPYVYMLPFNEKDGCSVREVLEKVYRLYSHHTRFVHYLKKKIDQKKNWESPFGKSPNKCSEEALKEAQNYLMKEQR